MMSAYMPLLETRGIGRFVDPSVRVRRCPLNRGIGTKSSVDTRKETVYAPANKVRKLVRIHKLIFTDSYVTELGGYLLDNVYQMLNYILEMYTTYAANMKS